ncbi:MAG: 16S rRNA (cytidine(1402)-2'-O)-methyltransferase [Candidatus Omnitrophica bacterium]|nr:16S rRNA (cytidine(1402)-2'-O)-methyltransferase [Candidatus Omnitrophota bacterium]
MLYIVSTPIGNLKDITLRAIETLKGVDLVAAEDTRHTRKLLDEYGITTKLTSYYDHNKETKSKQLLKYLVDGLNIALVTDAGTPGISDPGYVLVRLAREYAIEIDVLPGPTALIAALSLSGLPTDAFIFEGFLPVKPGKRKKKLAALADETRTVIFYESPHRLLKSLEDIRLELADPEVCVAREITKKFQQVKTGPSSELIAHFTAHPPKGEFVLLFNLAKAQDQDG